MSQVLIQHFGRKSQETPQKVEAYSLDWIRNQALELQECSPQTVIEWASKLLADKLTIATGFGVEGMVLIDMAVKINSKLDIFFIDTSFLFPETYDLRYQIEDKYQIKLRAISPELTPETQQNLYGKELWLTDPDLCCYIRKIEPLKKALNGYNGWMTAIRRNQTAIRSKASVVEWDNQWQILKINPLVNWSKAKVWSYIVENNVPYNPLYDKGYPSIGCTHCTRPVNLGEDERAGRWAGKEKTECGLHGGNKLISLRHNP
ncbi:MAG: phosphoadenylyl-sulfate reductase [Acidobacteria bacterium]|nr:phosphoadenylyl-sulfate reductase [Acidobacteriota bacterium]